MATKRLTERFALTRGTVDRTGAYPVVRDVLLCGLESANRRRYKVSAFGPADRKQYENRLVFLNHGDGKKSRQYEDKLGWVENERRDDKGRPIGDLGINPKHPYAETFLFDAEHRPKDCGMSHVAHCKTTTARDGWEDVDEVVEIESVDVVCDPATTPGLIENRNRAMSLSVKALCEALVKHPKTTFKQVAPLKTLAEFDGMGDAPTAMDAPPADDAEPVDGVKEAFKSAVQHIVDKALEGELDAKDALSKIKTLLKSHGEVNGKETPAEEPEKKPDDAEESKRKHADAILEAVEVCTKAGFRPDRADLDLIANATAEKRPELANRLKALAESTKAQPPTAASRRPGAGVAGAIQPPKTEQTAAKPPLIADTF